MSRSTRPTSFSTASASRAPARSESFSTSRKRPCGTACSSTAAKAWASAMTASSSGASTLIRASTISPKRRESSTAAGWWSTP
ncbi:MAG: hypothetical protein AMS16_02310 [Planctomycetes bacterium DG_58]|nr:MAG: hypothetical protein AMS16_02310 [Planctomycetes bacterium DG_58]